MTIEAPLLTRADLQAALPAGFHPDLIKDYSHLSPAELLEMGIRTERMETITVGNVMLGGAIVDENHARELAVSMGGDRGQISPLTVRARLTPEGFIAYDIIDGFHRASALSAMGKEDAKAVVIYGCLDEELFDLRVLAANSVRSVQFARVARWMQNSFAQTPWAQKGLTLSQVFSLVVFETSGLRLHLTPEEANQAKAWVVKKAGLWNKKVATIWEEMRAVEVADPDLINKVRVGGGGGHSKKGILSPARLIAIVRELPNTFELQNRVAQIVLDGNLIRDEAHALAKAAAAVKDNPAELEKVFQDPLAAINRVLSEREGQSNQQKDSTGLATGHFETTAGFMVPGLDQGLLPDQVATSNLPPEEQVYWWRNCPYISDKERRTLSMVFDMGMNFEEVADEMKLLSLQVISLFISGVRRYVLYRNEVKTAQDCRRSNPNRS